MSASSCPVPGCGVENPRVSIFVNNSVFEPEKGIDETELTFDVSLPEPQTADDNGTSVFICDECWQNERHLKN